MIPSNWIYSLLLNDSVEKFLQGIDRAIVYCSEADSRCSSIDVQRHLHVYDQGVIKPVRGSFKTMGDTPTACGLISQSCF